MKVRKSAVTLWVLVLLGMMIVSGCSPITVETPVPTPDIAATVEAAVAVALASQPTPDLAATVKAAVATEVAATQAAQEPTATPTPVPPTAMLISTRTVVKTIEAENCEIEEGCRLEEFWKLWADPGFSNGQLINNEASLGKAADLKLFLTFQGTGIVIVYRQDRWYGTLGVEIDDQVGSINQQGPTKNHAEVCFEAGGSGNHTLTLSGSKAGVITIDAIKILDGDAPCKQK